MSLGHVLIVLVASSTIIVLAAITLEFTGMIDLGCDTQGCSVRIEKLSDSS